MSAHAYARRPAPAAQPDPQPRLFALPGGAVAEPLPEERPQRPVLAPVPEAPAQAGPARGARAGRTLDAELRLAWTALAANAPAECVMCGGRMEPHAGATGGSCTSCGTVLE